MSELVFRVAAGNLVLSLALAAVAWAVQTWGRRPRIAHVLWLLVLVKLVTPPVVAVPVIAAPAASAPIDATAISTANLLDLLVWAWLAGSAVILAASMVRILRFHRLLRTASEPAPRRMVALARELSSRLELRRVPEIRTTCARVSPLVWWMGGRVSVLVPAGLSREMNARELRWVLAHELAHVRRRDHVVRWLEWLACVTFWWNPAAWWARRNLRVNEEICCDALVLERLSPDPRAYGNSLLNAVGFLAAPALRPPAVASEMDSAGILELRIRTIVSGSGIRRTSRGARGLLLLLATIVVPLGFARAERPEDEGSRLRAAAVRDVPADGPRALVDSRRLERYRGMERRLSSTAKEERMAREEVGRKLDELRSRRVVGPRTARVSGSPEMR
jgi:beta-lactamase regulating signal transducer with metallopeptidase domain